MQDLGQLVGFIGFQDDLPSRCVEIASVVGEEMAAASVVDHQAESLASAGGDVVRDDVVAGHRIPMDVHGDASLGSGSAGDHRVWHPFSVGNGLYGQMDAGQTTLVGMKRARTPAAALFRRVFLINGLIFVLGTLILAVSPATVSARIKLTEIPVLIVGLAIMLTANALLLRSSLAPLDRLAASMRRVDPPKRSDRVDDRGTGDLHHLIASFNAMLDRLETERTTASASALAAQENERQRIARELHDEIGQTLTVALLFLKRAVDRAPADIRGELADTQEAVRAGIDEVRSIARRLRPDALEDLGLHSALSALCSEFTQATGIGVVKHIASQSDRLKSDVELVCYRIAQESLTNVARHAEASKVWLDLHTTAEQLTLRIADDGRGGAVAEGAGINGMRERALLVNATLAITSPADEGTEVRLAIPLCGRGA